MRNIVIAAVLLLPTLAYADDDTSRWVLKMSGMGVFPRNTEESYQTRSGKSVISDWSFADNEFGVNADAVYFLSDRWAIDGSLGWFPTRPLNIYFKDNASTTFDTATKKTTGHLNLFPMATLVQFHIAPYGEIRPYVGAGVHYTYVSSAMDGVNSKNASGLVGQVGFDWWESPSWGFTMDMRYYRMHIDNDYSHVAGAPFHTTLELNPLIVSAGVAYRF